MTRRGAGSSPGAGSGPPGQPPAGPGALPAPDQVPTPWVATYPPGVPVSYRWPDVLLPRLLDDAARDFPATTGAADPAGTWSWAQLRTWADTLAVALERAGVREGDRVGLVATSGPVALVVAFAAWRAGAVLVPMPPAASPADHAWLLATARPVLSVVEGAADPGWCDVDHPVVRVSIDDLVPRGRLRRLVRRHRGRRGDPIGGRGATWDDLLGTGPDGPGVLRVDGSVAGAPGDTPSGDGAHGRAAVLLTARDAAGRRRLATLTHHNLVASVLQARLWLPDVQAGREVVLCPAPLHTGTGLVGGLLLATLAGGTLVVPRPGTGEVAGPAPTLLLADHEDLVALEGPGGGATADLSSLRAGLVLGGRMSAAVTGRLAERSGHARLRRGLAVPGATFLTHANPVYGRADPAHVGLPVTGTVAAVVDPDDPSRARPDGRPGRLVVAGPQVMAGYWRDPAATAAVRRDGWLLTDLLAVRDATGAFALVGLVGDTGGEEATS